MARKGLHVVPDQHQQLCADAGAMDSCTGDSGGPLMTIDRKTNRWYQVAIVSYGSNRCGVSEWPNVNTMVSYYLDWIRLNIYE